MEITRIWRGLPLLLLAGCNASPDVVSFNTPELCEPEVTGIASFTLARVQCDDECQICIDSTLEDQALTYSIVRDANCVCKAPEVYRAVDDAKPSTEAGVDVDAARTSEGGLDAHVDASAVQPSDAALPGAADGAVPNGGRPTIAPDGCHSQLNLTQGAAANFCSGKTDCHVCVERVDFDKEPRRYMAHECGCPRPYRLE